MNLHSAAQTEQFLSLPGEFYADFGIFGIIIGGFLVGAGVSLIYSKFILEINNRGTVFLYFLFFVTVLLMLVFGSPTIYAILVYFMLPYMALSFTRLKPI